MNDTKTLELKVSHSSFSLIFPTLLYVVCNALVFDKISKWFYLGDQVDYFALFAYYIFGLSFFIVTFLIFAHRWMIKTVSIIFIVLSSAATYFISKYDVAVDRTMIMNTVYTDPTEVSGLLSVYMIPYLVFLIILPIMVLLYVKIIFHRPVKHIFTSLKIAILTLTIGLVLVYINFNAINRAGNISNKYIIHSLVPVNLISSIYSVISRSIKPYFNKNKEEVKITGHISSQNDLVVVLVIGETARQKNFSLYGYDRKNTNPILSKYKNIHALNGIARIGTTLYALPEILESSEIKLPAITSKLGIDTSCYVNYTLYDNCSSVGEIAVNNCGHGGTCYDEDVIPLLENNLKSYSSGYKFVLLHLGGGSHGPTYNDRHPPEFQQFKPICFDADVVNNCTIEQLYNSYDNTILYTDSVLGNIINKLENSGAPYVFIYLSDHGESLLEEGRIFHGMPPGIPLPPEQAQVPLLVKSSIPISIVKREEYMQQDVFHTILDLFTIETEILDRERSFIKKTDGGVKYLETENKVDSSIKSLESVN